MFHNVKVARNSNFVMNSKCFLNFFFFLTFQEPLFLQFLIFFEKINLIGNWNCMFHNAKPTGTLFLEADTLSLDVYHTAHNLANFQVYQHRFL